MARSNYQKNVKKYLDDLSKKGFGPGGGSAGALSFLLGVSLIVKSISHSLGKTIDKRKKKKLKCRLGKLKLFKKRVFPYIDKDGELFSKAMRNKGQNRQKFLKKATILVKDLGQSSREAFLLAKGIEFDIKKSIKSDFYLGLEFIKVSLLSSILNLEANRRMFGIKDKSLDSLKKTFKKIKGK